MGSFCGSDNDENYYEIGYREGAAVLGGLLAMAEAIRSVDRSPWTCGDCGREGLTWQHRCPCHEREMAEDLCLHRLFGECPDCDDTTPALRPGHREPIKGGAEDDAFTAWRKFICWGRGEVSRVKRGFSRRTRRKSKQRTKETR